jgi:hypothetical protein
MDAWTRSIGRWSPRFRQFLTTPIVLTPCVERGYRAIRIEGRLGLAAVVSGAVTKVASHIIPSWNQILLFLRQMARLREIAGATA